MEIGLVGLPNAGKSTLFNALTKAGAPAADYPFTTIEPNVGMVTVPDERFDRLVALINPAKVVPANVRFVDIAGLVKGASQGEGLGNQFLGHIREVDAVAQVVRCFEAGVPHVAGQVSPADDIETINTELVIGKTGYQAWYYQGKIHRVDGPAVIYQMGEEVWYYHDKLHRVHGPAVRDEAWYYQGKRHRDNGPAVTRCGTKEWWINGQCHRVDGPAVIKEGIERWYYQGRLHRDNGPAVIDRRGIEEWYCHDKLHRVGGPALINKWGDELWYYQGKRHRLDGPADNEWWLNGVLHREDGPAVIRDGIEEWWFNGERQYESRFAHFNIYNHLSRELV